MKCREAEDLLEACGASTQAFALATVKVLGGSRVELSTVAWGE